MRSTGCLKIAKDKMFEIFRDGIYGDSDVFVRELIANAYDATVKGALSDFSFPNQTDDKNYKIVIETDVKARTITFRDFGIGMTFEEIDCYINHMALSGTQEFLTQQLMKKGDNSEEAYALIGNFGLGFYSAFMAADQVEIISKSKVNNDAAPVHWIGKCNMQFSMEEGKKDSAGTDIILHIKEEKYLQEDELKKAVNKYCRFLSIPIYLYNVQDGNCICVNEPNPVWHNKQIKKQDLPEFYHSMFEDYQEPAEFINLNYEKLGIKGIIFLRRLSEKNVSVQGKIKVYSNGIFVAENVKELLPDFLMMQNGCIDIQRLPMKASREQLKEDGYAASIKNYLSEVIGRRLLEWYTEDILHYERLWKELNPFVKFAYIQNRRFRAAIGEAVLFEDTAGRFLPISSLLSHENGSKAQEERYYCTDEFCQLQHIKLFENKEIQVFKLSHVIDQPLIRFLEMENPQIRFLRVDSQVVRRLANNPHISDERQRKIINLFEGSIETRISAEVVSFDTEDFAAIIMMDEAHRRIQDVNEIYNLMQSTNLNAAASNIGEILLINDHSKIIEKMLHMKDKYAQKKMCRFIYELAEFNRGLPEDVILMSFVKQCQEMLSIAAETF